MNKEQPIPEKEQELRSGVRLGSELNDLSAVTTTKDQRSFGLNDLKQDQEPKISEMEEKSQNSIPNEREELARPVNETDPNTLKNPVDSHLLKGRADDSNEVNLEFIEKKIQGIEVVVEEVKDSREMTNIQTNWTFLAMKNPKSYLIGTYRQRFDLIDNGRVLFSGKLPEEDNELYDMAYIPVMDCYFLVSFYNLYLKDINNRPASLFLALPRS